jgi:hypothetical protein
MSKRDDYLEEKLSALEQGAEPSNFLLGDVDSGEEAALVNLATSIRNVTHPELDQVSVISEKLKIISAARDKFPAKKGLRASLNGRFSGQWLFVSGVAGAALILLMAFVMAASVGLYFSGPRGAQAATLVDVTGVLEVSDTEFAGDWHSISSGDKVRSGQRLRTGADSSVKLVFFEGTQTTLGPNTDLVLNKIEGSWGNELQVELIQNGGETDHQVIPLQGDQASYHLLTPSGSASVRGTSFSVMVDDTGLSLFTVDTGEVLITNDGTETFVSAGQGIVTELGESLDFPAYLFTLQGELIDNIGTTWEVEDVEIIIKDGTRIYGDPQINEIVLVHGHITKENEWVAHTIDTPFVEGKGGTFTGLVTAVGEDSVEINGISFTFIGAQQQVAVGDLVRVTFSITPSGWVVDSLIPLEKGEIPDDDDDNGDDDQDLRGELYFNPEKHRVTVCEPESELAREFVTTLNYAKVDENVPSIDVLLGYEIIEGMEFIAEVSLSADDVVLAPETIVTLSDGTPVTIKVKVTLKPDFVKLPPEGEIKIQIVSTQAIEDEPLSDNFKVKWECDEELPDDDTDDEEGKDGHYCTTEDIHPHAAQLAEKYSDLVAYGATYENIMIWFCQYNLGFGEIEQAFKLFRLYQEEILLITEVNVIQDIIDMRLSGLGWGQVKQKIATLAREVSPDDESSAGKKEPPGKEKSEEAKNKEKPDKKKKKDE